MRHVPSDAHGGGSDHEAAGERIVAADGAGPRASRWQGATRPASQLISGVW